MADAFLHIADLHFWRVVWNPLRLCNKRFLGNANVFVRRRHEYVSERAGPFAEYAAALGIEQVVCTGDFTSTALPEEFAQARKFVERLRGLGLRVRLMPGNHDVYTFESVRSNRFEQYMGNSYPRHGRPLMDELPGGTSLIRIDTARPNVLSSRGIVTEETVETLKEMLAGVDQDPVVVAAHYPALHKTYGYTLNKERELIGAEALREALGRSGKPILYMAGHVHRFSCVVDPEHSNVRHLTTGCFFRTDERQGLQGEFAEIHVQSAGIEVIRHTCAFDGEWRATRAQPLAGAAALEPNSN